MITLPVLGWWERTFLGLCGCSSSPEQPPEGLSLSKRTTACAQYPLHLNSAIRTWDAPAKGAFTCQTRYQDSLQDHWSSGLTLEEGAPEADILWMEPPQALQEGNPPVEHAYACYEAHPSACAKPTYLDIRQAAPQHHHTKSILAGKHLDKLPCDRLESYHTLPASQWIACLAVPQQSAL